jgi:TM2 domain-containing membrane protein YozV
MVNLSMEELKSMRKKVKRLKEKKQKLKEEEEEKGKSQLVALLLCIFLGGLGIHRFYLGYVGIGIIQLLTAGCCGIWWLIDFIRIATGDLKPKDAEYKEKL